MLSASFTVILLSSALDGQKQDSGHEKKDSDCWKNKANVTSVNEVTSFDLENENGAWPGFYVVNVFKQLTC